jgi:hypothetical protein
MAACAARSERTMRLEPPFALADREAVFRAAEIDAKLDQRGNLSASALSAPARQRAS